MQKHGADYMALVGAFLWLANVSRPELSYISSQLARFVSNPGEVHYSAALRVLLYLKGSADRQLHYQPVASRDMAAPHLCRLGLGRKVLNLRGML